jgi:hypothetical protein
MPWRNHAHKASHHLPSCDTRLCRVRSCRRGGACGDRVHGQHPRSRSGSRETVGLHARMRQSERKANGLPPKPPIRGRPFSWALVSAYFSSITLPPMLSGSSQPQCHSFTAVTIVSLLYGQRSGPDFRGRHRRLGPYQRPLNESAVPHVTKEASVALGECTMY